MSDDTELLRAYAKEGSEAAFRQLVERHIPLVQATAQRIVAGDLHLAQDVTQTVFTDLARKAATLPTGVVLGGWLHRHTCFTAAKAVRTEQRRRARERTAMEINTINDNTGHDAQWAQLAPVLDDALNSLPTDDRDAIVLRYFERRDLRSIGATLGISDDTAQKRISRALEKLRGILTNRGVTVSAVLLSTTLDAGAATIPASVGLITSISANALVGASATTSTLFTALKIMSNTKRVLGVAAIVTLGIAIVVTHQNHPATPSVTLPDIKPIAKVSATVITKVEAPKKTPTPAGDKPDAAPPPVATMQPIPSTIPELPDAMNPPSSSQNMAAQNSIRFGGKANLPLENLPGGPDQTTISVSITPGQTVTVINPDGTSRIVTIGTPPPGSATSESDVTFTLSNGTTLNKKINTAFDTNGAPIIGMIIGANGINFTENVKVPAGASSSEPLPNGKEKLTFTDPTGVTHTVVAKVNYNDAPTSAANSTGSGMANPSSSTGTP